MDPLDQQETRELRENLDKMVSQECKEGLEEVEDLVGPEKREKWVHLDSLESQEVMVCLEDLGCLAHLDRSGNLERTG